MRLFSRKYAGLFLFICAAQAVLATPAQASSLSLVSSQMLMFLQIASAPNQCISYSYDRNGNITARNNKAYGAQGTWGSSVYGCFSWTSS